jgi:outer membrane protein
MQEKLEKEGMTMSDAERRSREKEFGELNREFQRKQREFREDLSVRQNEELASLYDSVNKVIRKIAETEKYDLIVQEAVYYSPNIDITGKVIKALAEGTAASAPSAATSASAR